MADEWDTGAEASELEQDKFNKFDPSKAVGGPPQNTQDDVVQSTPKPQYKPVEVTHVPSKAAPSAPKPAMNAAASPPKQKIAAAAPPVARVVAQPPVINAPALPAVTDKFLDKALTEVSQPRTFSQRFKEGDKPAGGAAFTENLTPEALSYFSELCSKPFSTQAVAFLNAYWSEIGSQSEFIFTVAWEKIKSADMHAKGVQYIHLYDEGNDLEFNIGLYFYEQLCKEVLESKSGAKWRDDPKYEASMPQMLTALVRKQELREKVDVNFDGKVSFLEYLLYQYRAYANPGDFVKRSMEIGMENPAIAKARQALEEVNKAIREYEAEKSRLERDTKLGGVKGLGAKAALAILNASPLAERLNTALITAEASVRIAGRKFGNTGSVFTISPDARAARPTDGALWWMSRDLADKKARYGRA